MIGLHLSHYAIEAELGRGGMGIVFRAKDTKLNRTVALKVLPAGALASEDDRARFRREAQASAQLNHPNVCHVYQVDEAQPLTPDGNAVEGHMESRLFIAMEYIDGETLQDHVKKGPLKLREAVNIAGQVAEALKAAHAKDIVHRDIKSANVMLTPDGVAKVLDFGLAKTNASTMLTRMGSTLGTIAYMSPEQARGEEVDGRSDLYSLGTVLYEMISGKLPFAGGYEQAVVYQILNEDPEPLTAVRTGVPMGLEWIVNKLLSKEPRHRYQTAADLVADLETVDMSGSGLSRRSVAHVPSAHAKTAGLKERAWPALAALLLAAVAILGWIALAGPDATREPVHLSVNLPDATDPFMAAWMPDGSAFYYRAIDTTRNTTRISRYDLATGQATTVSGTDGAHAPYVSPDGESLVFLAEGLYNSVPTAGGVPTVMPGTRSQFPSGYAGLNGELIFSSNNGSIRRRLESGDVETIGSSAGTGQMFMLPYKAPGSEVVHWVGFVDSNLGIQAYRLGPDDGAPQTINPSHGLREVFNNGIALLFPPGGVMSGEPWNVARFDASDSEVRSSPVATLSARSVFSSPAGHVLYEELGDDRTFIGQEQVYRIVAGARELRLGPAGSITGDIAASRGSDRFAVEARDEVAAGYGIVVLDPASGTETRLTRDGANLNPSWGPGDEYVYFNRRQAGSGWTVASPFSDSVQVIARRRADGAGELEVVVTDTLNSTNPTVSPDGSLLVYQSFRRDGTGWDLYGHRFATGRSFPIVVEARGQLDPVFSPNGRYLSYRSTGSPEGVVVVAPDGSGMVQVADGGGLPAWSPDGRYLYFVRDSRRIFRIPVSTNPVFRTTGGEELVYDATTADHVHFDLTSDGSPIVKRPGPLGLASETGLDIRMVLNFDVMAERMIDR